MNDFGAVPARWQAEAILVEAARLNPGPWEAHSRFVALGAERIAHQLAEFDPDRAFILGLLHDIGRRFGPTGMRHAVDGYRFLIECGYPGAARICITHSYPDPMNPHGATGFDGTQAEQQFLREYLAAITYDDYDRLIILCDCLALPSGFCLMEKRLVDVVRRYGFDEHTLARWQGFFEIKKHLENRLGCSVYRLLPGVVEATFD